MPIINWRNSFHVRFPLSSFSSSLYWCFLFGTISCNYFMEIYVAHNHMKWIKAWMKSFVHQEWSSSSLFLISRRQSDISSQNLAIHMAYILFKMRFCNRISVETKWKIIITLDLIHWYNFFFSSCYHANATFCAYIFMNLIGYFFPRYFIPFILSLFLLFSLSNLFMSFYTCETGN